MVYFTSYTIKQMANILGVHPDTLRNWERDKLLIPYRVGKRGDRRYTDEHIRQVQEKNLIPNPQIQALKRTEEYEKYTKEQLIDKIDKLENMKEKVKFGLVWEDSEKEEVVERCKREAPILAHQAAKRVFSDKNKPNNVFIEGDNYHALQVLNYTHRGKIDVIYIDPPYNTGNNNWFYNDKYVDAQDRFRHSKWLNMMKKRLALTVNLLSESGVIFISIDDNEQAHLKLLCDDIFGEENFVANLNIYSNPRGRQSSAHFAETHEYILVYAKSKPNLVIRGEELTEEQKREYGKKDGEGLYREIGLRKRGAGARREDSPNLFFPIYYDEKTSQISLEKKGNTVEILPALEDGSFGRWRWSRGKILADMDCLIARKVRRNGDEEYDIFEKDYLLETKTRKIKTSWFEKEINYDRSSQEQREIFGKKMLEYTKPLYLLNKVVRMASKKESIILDFFAGSGTTGHAVLQLNKEDGGNRKFILCTNNENHNGNGSRGIAESVCYPRIRKIIEGYKKNGNGENVAGLGGNLEYFKTEFIDIEDIKNVRDDSKLEFTHKAGQILALKEDCFKEVERNKHYQIFTNNVGKHVGVYFREGTIKLDELDKKLLDKPEVKMYIFNYDGGGFNWRKRYANYGNVKVENIPEPILKVYREVNL